VVTPLGFERDQQAKAKLRDALSKALTLIHNQMPTNRKVYLHNEVPCQVVEPVTGVFQAQFFPLRTFRKPEQLLDVDVRKFELNLGLNVLALADALVEPEADRATDPDASLASTLGLWVRGTNDGRCADQSLRFVEYLVDTIVLRAKGQR